VFVCDTDNLASPRRPRKRQTPHDHAGQDHQAGLSPIMHPTPKPLLQLFRFLPPNSVQVVAHIFAVSPFSTFDPRLPQEGGELQIRLTRTHPFQLTRGSLTEFGGPRSLPCSRDRGLPLPCPPAPRRTPGAEPCHHYNIPAKARKSQLNESTEFRTQDSGKSARGFSLTPSRCAGLGRQSCISDS
jgi:hypothetical protein